MRLDVFFAALMFGFTALNAAIGSEITPAQRAAVKSVTDKIIVLCERKWPNDFAMERHCRDEQLDGWLAYRKAAPELLRHDVLTKAMAICRLRWKADGEVIDWTMVMYCYEEQKTAAKLMRKF